MQDRLLTGAAQGSADRAAERSLAEHARTIYADRDAAAIAGGVAGSGAVPIMMDIAVETFVEAA